MGDTKKSEYDLRQERRKQISERVRLTEDHLANVYKDRSLEQMKNHVAELRVLYGMFKFRLDADTKEEIEEKMRELSEKVFSDSNYESIQLRDHQELHDLVHNSRIKAGLDLPTEKEKESFGATEKPKGDRNGD